METCLGICFKRMMLQGQLIPVCRDLSDRLSGSTVIGSGSVRQEIRMGLADRNITCYNYQNISYTNHT